MISLGEKGSPKDREERWSIHVQVLLTELVVIGISAEVYVNDSTRVEYPKCLKMTTAKADTHR